MLNKNKSKCRRGHEFTLENTIFRKTNTGIRRTCRACDKAWRKDNREWINSYQRRFYKKRGHEQKDRALVYARKYYRENSKAIIAKKAIYHRERRKTDIQFKITCVLRSRLSDCLRGNQKTGSAVRDLGCSVAELKKYLEGKFSPGMNWSNHGYHGWHIDHIVPLVNFDLTDRSHFLKAFHYTNLQPLWAQDNLRKTKKRKNRLPAVKP